jgi:hypothetical protein
MFLNIDQDASATDFAIVVCIIALAFTLPTTIIWLSRTSVGVQAEVGGLRGIATKNEHGQYAPPPLEPLN